MTDAMKHLQQLIREHKEAEPRKTFEDAVNRTPVANTQGLTADQMLTAYREVKAEQSSQATPEEDDAAAEVLANEIIKGMRR